MGFAERVLAYEDLKNSLMIARAVFDEYGLDLEKEAARLNNKSSEFGMGEMLRDGAKAAVDRVIQAGTLRTPKGPVRTYAFVQNFTLPNPEANHKSMSGPEQEPELKQEEKSDAVLLNELREGVAEQFKRNGDERRAGDFRHILDCTVKEICNLAARYRKTAKTYSITAARYEWLASEAVKRGLGEDETLRNVFTEDELAQEAIPTETQPMFELEDISEGDQPLI